MKTRKQLEKQGWKFVWAESAYRVCVHAPNGTWLGTFDSRRAYEIPGAAREAINDSRPDES